MRGFAVRNGQGTTLFVIPDREGIDRVAIVRILKAGGLRNLTLDEQAKEHN